MPSCCLLGHLIKISLCPKSMVYFKMWYNSSQNINVINVLLLLFPGLCSHHGVFVCLVMDGDAEQREWKDGKSYPISFVFVILCVCILCVMMDENEEGGVMAWGGGWARGRKGSHITSHLWQSGHSHISSHSFSLVNTLTKPGIPKQHSNGQSYATLTPMSIYTWIWT